jgi:hypothetical protein
VLLVGDSMIAGALGLFLERGLRESGHLVSRRGRSSTGLARPDFFDWQSAVREAVTDTNPEVAVAMFGGNDVQGLWLAPDRWIRWQDPGWSEEYARRVDAFCDALSSSGAHIVWIGLPAMRSPRFSSRVERVNTIYRAEMAIRSRARFLDTWSVLADEGGGYVDHVELADEPRPDGRRKRRRVRVRAGDGIHLTTEGARMLAAWVLGELGSTLVEP